MQRQTAVELPFAGESSPRVQYVAGDGWDRGVGFTRPPIIGREVVTRPYLEEVWVRAALKAVSEPASRLPLRLWDRPPEEEGAVEITDHPLATMWKRPNALLTGTDLWKIHLIGYRLSGATYLFLANDDGRPIGPTELPTQIIPIMRHGVNVEDEDEFGLPKTYTYSFGSKKVKLEFPASAVIPILDFNPYNWTEGFGDGEVLADDIDTAHQALRYLASFVRSGGDPGAWFKFKHKLNLEEANRLQGEVDDEYAAAGVSRYKVVSGEIDDIIPNQVRPRDLEYEKLLDRERDIVLSVFGVPPPMVGILDDATYNNIRTAELLMWRGPNGILTTVRRTEEALNQLFLPRMLGRSADPSFGLNGRSRVKSTWTYRFDASEVEVLQSDVQDEIKLAAEIVAKNVGITYPEALEMLGAEGVWTKDLAGESPRLTTANAAFLSNLASKVHNRQLEPDVAIEIVQATLGAGILDDAQIKAMFPEPPEPEPVVVAPGAPGAAPGPPGAKGVPGAKGTPSPPPPATKPPEPVAKPKKKLAYEREPRRATYSFEPGKPIVADRQFTAIVVGWLEDYERAQIALWKAIAADEKKRPEDAPLAPALAQSLAIGETYVVEPSALDPYLLAVEKWAEELEAGGGVRLEQIVQDALNAAHDDLGGPFISVTDPRVLQQLRDQKLVFKGVTETLTEEIRDLLVAAMNEAPDLPIETLITDTLPELTENLRRVFGTKEARANAISRTETGRAQNSSYFLQMRESGVTRIAWQHSGNPNGREDHVAMNGEEVPIGEEFSNGLRYPHDPQGDASDVVNCGCSLRATAFEDDDE